MGNLNLNYNQIRYAAHEIGVAFRVKFNHYVCFALQIRFQTTKKCILSVRIMLVYRHLMDGTGLKATKGLVSFFES